MIGNVKVNMDFDNDRVSNVPGNQLVAETLDICQTNKIRIQTF